MDLSRDISDILIEWEFDPFQVNVRKIELPDRMVLQMRIDLGVLQLEIEGRPDGKKPGGEKTLYHHLVSEAAKNTKDFTLDDDQCLQIDREFVQFYNRRVCWLQLKEFGRAVNDADHTLALMDFCESFSSDEQWTISHEQYRPFVVYHRTQAAALEILRRSESDEEKASSAEDAIHEINTGLDRLKTVFSKYGAVEQFEEDELVKRLSEFRESLREKYAVGKTLDEQLLEAVSNEQYEKAAQIRDLIKRRKPDSPN